MQAKKKVVALIEPGAGNVDVAFQRSILTRYASKHDLNVDQIVGERAPAAGAAGGVDHQNLVNDIKQGGVGHLLILAEVRHAVPEDLLEECRNADVKVHFVDVHQERGLGQPV